MILPAVTEMVDTTAERAQFGKGSELGPVTDGRMVPYGKQPDRPNDCRESERGQNFYLVGLGRCTYSAGEVLIFRCYYR